MDCKDLVIDGLARVEESFLMTLEGLSAEQLAFRPADHANSIAWLAWHITRVADDHMSDLAGTSQAWIADGWHARFNRPANAHDVGFGHGPQDVASIRPDGPQLLVEYYAAVHQRSIEYLSRLTCADLDRVVDTRWNPPVTAGVRLVSVVNDTTQHVGQMAYLRGLVEDKKWLPY
jgi:uncharacterized damage-inducible protein DinB